LDDFHYFPLVGRHVAVAEHFHHSGDSVERGTDFMAHVSQEFGLGAVGLLCGAARTADSPHLPHQNGQRDRKAGRATGEPPAAALGIGELIDDVALRTDVDPITFEEVLEDALDSHVADLGTDTIRHGGDFVVGSDARA
jgi:hypothetical protein